MILKKIQSNFNGKDIFSLLCLPILGLGWLGIVLTLAGIFYSSILYAYIFASLFFVASAISFFWKKNKLNYNVVLILAVALLAVLLFSYFTTPTIFSGRDQGSLSQAAIQLSQSHKITSSSTAEKEFFKIYGPGKALNFPGFNYTQSGELMPQFPVGYISWLAIFYSIFNLEGLVIANALTFLVFLLAFYFLGQKYLKNYPALVLILSIVTSFIFSWFFKFTLSENLALMLVWLGIHEFIIFLENKKRFYLTMAILSFGLLLFSRIEAVLFLAVIGLIIFQKYKKNIRSAMGRNIIWLSIIIIAIYILSLITSYPFYVILAKSAVKLFTGSSSDNAAALGSLGFLAETINVFKVFLVYALLPYLILGIFSVIYFWRKKQYAILLPFFIVAPTFLYILNPNISGDHPWMLRRFLFSVIPACILYTFIFLDRFFSKKIIFHISSAILIASNLLIFWPLINFSPHRGLLKQTKALSQNFQNSDLILIDQEASGDGWSMLTGPMNFLYGKQAVYFFNSKDLEKIDLTKFSSVYFIISDKNIIEFFDEDFEKLSLVKDYHIVNEVLGANLEGASFSEIYLPQKQELITNGGIYLLKK